MADTVCFRVDASLQIGTGHVTRCLTLADALAQAGERCHFICRADPGNLVDEIVRRGHTVDVLTSAPAGSEPGVYDGQADAAGTAAVVGNMAVSVLVVDHYAIDSAWEQTLRAHCRRLLVIDDLANRPHECDLLIDQNLGRRASDYARLVPARCEVLAGPGYALLRPEFAQLRPDCLRRRQHAALRSVLIAMGGVDLPNATARVLEALGRTALPQSCRITVIMGAQAPWLAPVREQATRMPWPTEVQVNVADMAMRMAECDLAVGAAGGSAWERCCLGLPTLLVVLADNQWPGAQALAREGAALLLGEVAAIDRELPAAIAALADSTTLRRMSRIAGRIADGQGVHRVIRQLRTTRD